MLLFRKVVGEVFNQLGGTLGVVSPVQHKIRVVCQHLKSCRPAYGVNPVLQRLRRDFPALLAQHLGGLNHHRCVSLLVGTQQRQSVGCPLIGKHLAFQAVKFRCNLRKVRCTERSFLFPADVSDHFLCFPALLIEHTVTALLDDPGLFPRNLGNAASQNLCVIQPDVHDYAHFRLFHNIGGVEPAAEPGFQHDDVTFFLRKPEKGARRHHLKSSGVVLRFLCRCPDSRGNLCQSLIADFLPVHLHPLVEAVQIGGGEKSRAIPRRLQHRSAHSRAASLAVGPGDMDAPQLFLRLAQGCEKPAEALQSPL